LWRHGGVVFGPHPRDFYLRLPSKIKKAALKSSLNVKVKDNNFIILDKISLSAQKTKEAAKIFSSLKADPRKEKKSYKVLLLVDKTETGNNLALRNIGFLNTNITAKTHAYEILANHKIVITQEGLKSLTERINKK
jgi:large subunit ribosomal protein L4